MSPKKYKVFSFIFFFCTILSILAILIFIWTVNEQRHSIHSLENENRDLLENLSTNTERLLQSEEQIEQRGRRILDLETENAEKARRISFLENEVYEKTQKIQELVEEYASVKPFQERVERGQRIDLYYPLLRDTEEYTRPLALQILGFSSPQPVSGSADLWNRGKRIYDWLSNNYAYCGDKGLRIGSTFAQFQFYSPDELLLSDNARCGDCDDFATLFAGLMYASGATENQVAVVCGMVPQGAHCWNELNMGTQQYLIDGVCSQKKDVFRILGFSWSNPITEYPESPQNVGCFTSYDAQVRITPTGFSFT